MRKLLSIVLAVMMVLSTVSFAAPSAIGAPETALEVPAADTAVAPLEAALEAESDYGTLLWDLDFESEAFNADPKQGQPIEFYSSKTQPTLPAGFEGDYYLTGYTFSTALFDRDNYELSGSTCLSVYGVQSVIYPFIAVQAYKSEDNHEEYATWPDGTYTVVADVAYEYYNDADRHIYQARFSTQDQQGGATVGLQQEIGYEMSNYVVSFDVEYSEDGATLDITGDTGSATTFEAPLRSMGVYFGQLTSEDFIYVDNFKIYFKPSKVNVTINENGEYVKTVEASTKGVLVSELVEMAELGADKTVTGVSVNGEAKSLSDTVVFGADSTLDITTETIDVSDYVHAEYGKMLFNVTFEDEALGAEITNNDQSPVNLEGSYLTPFTASMFAHDANKWLIMSNTVDHGGIKTFVMTDPTDPTNKVAGVENITSASGYPLLRVDTWVDYHKNYQWGFVEKEEGVLTVVYDIMDTKGELNFTERFGGNTTKAVNAGGWLDEREDQGDEFEGTIEANKFHTNVAQFSSKNYVNMASTTEVSVIKLHASKPISNSYYYDNIRLYWKPAKVDVTVKHVGVDLPDTVITDVSTTEGMSSQAILGLVDVSSVNQMTYGVKGISFDADGAELVDKAVFSEDTTLYMIWEEIDMSEWSDENGIIVMEMDFENVPDGSIETRTKITDFGGRVNPYFAHSDEWAIDLSGLNSPATVVNDAVKGKVLEATYKTTGSTSWPQFLFGYLENNKGLDTIIKKDGTFVISVDFKADYEAAAKYSGITIATNGYKNGAHQGAGNIMSFGDGLFTASGTLADNTWYTVGGTNGPANAGIDGPTKFTFVLQHNAGNTAGTVTKFYFDNIKVYWRPETVNATIDAGDNDEVSNVTFAMKTNGVSVENVMSNMIDWGSKKLVGLSLTEGGEALPAGTVLSPATDVTYYAVWEEYGTVLEGYSAEFDEVVETYDEISWATYGLGSSAADVFNYAKTPYEEGDTKYLSLKSLTAEGSNGIIDSQIRIDAPLPAGALDGIAVRMRMSGFPTEDYTVTVPGGASNGTDKVQTGKAEVLEPMKIYLGLAGMGLSETRAFRLIRDWRSGELEGKWFSYYFDLSENADVAANDLEYIRIDVPDAFPKDAVIDIDYIRFYGDDTLLSEKPTTLENAVSIRGAYDTDAEGTPRSGIRFKASMTAEMSTKATDYGWVLGSAGKLNTNAITIGTSNAIVRYAREAGVDKVNFFDSTNDEALIFTAVVYNIKPEYATYHIVARPFVKIDDVVYYGKPVKKSVYEIAKAAKEGGYVGLDDKQIAYVDATIEAVEKPAEDPEA